MPAHVSALKIANEELKQAHQKVARLIKLDMEGNSEGSTIEETKAYAHCTSEAERLRKSHAISCYKHFMAMIEHKRCHSPVFSSMIESRQTLQSLIPLLSSLAINSATIKSTQLALIDRAEKQQQHQSRQILRQNLIQSLIHQNGILATSLASINTEITTVDRTSQTITSLGETLNNLDHFLSNTKVGLPSHVTPTQLSLSTALRRLQEQSLHTQNETLHTSLSSLHQFIHSNFPNVSSTRLSTTTHRPSLHRTTPLVRTLVQVTRSSDYTSLFNRTNAENHTHLQQMFEIWPVRLSFIQTLVQNYSALTSELIRSSPTMPSFPAYIADLIANIDTTATTSLFIPPSLSAALRRLDIAQTFLSQLRAKAQNLSHSLASFNSARSLSAISLSSLQKTERTLFVYFYLQPQLLRDVVNELEKRINARRSTMFS
ncbi:hypothetical protein BLNAU_19700 [Blattamonas nauphoetae]|uniref:Uncharacterized protein n=1 Tax=Blattamonas nauphoetae TaxID=2049346 RepID=A0ABQ9X400_9EUKA|nr:hypothetical protein BLNAU_19700 [Blattamonas nauphoetae]